MTVFRLVKVIALLSVTLLAFSSALPRAGSVSTDQMGHIHAIRFAGNAPQQLVVAAQKGLFLLDSAGPHRLTDSELDVVDLTEGPLPGSLYASVHPGENDRTRLLRLESLSQPPVLLPSRAVSQVDMHQIAVSLESPNRIFGVHQGLQVSDDAGRSWRPGGSVPHQLLQIAGSATSPERLYAASLQGLYASENLGNSWQVLLPFPTTMVVTTPGQVFAFVMGRGLIQAVDGPLDALHWQPVSNGFGRQVLFDLAVSADGQRLIGLTQYNRLVESRNRGGDWAFFPATPAQDSRQLSTGQGLYQQHCQACHGIQGVGESYPVSGQHDAPGRFAPALNGSMHAWHHTDSELVAMILKGAAHRATSPAGQAPLGAGEAEAVIAYLKTFWGARQRRCQGPRHRDPACLYPP